jgi:hypothetical protein
MPAAFLILQLLECTALAYLLAYSPSAMLCRTFMEQLKASGDRLLKAPPAPPANLTPPAQVRNDQLRDWVRPATTVRCSHSLSCG